MNKDISELRLPDSTFWSTADRDPGLDPIVKAFKTSHFGILIDGPREVLLPQRQQFPMFAYYMGEYRQVVTRDFPRQAVLVAMDPVRNQLHVGPALADKGDTRPPSAKTPAKDLPNGYLMTFQRFDFRARTELPWQAGTIISQVLLLDLASNRVETKLSAGRR